MNTWHGPFPPRSTPIRVEGGLRARTTRGTIGASWWSQRFLAVLESFELHGRLARGRTYARQGQVLALHIDAGTVTATVQGSRATPYQVKVTVAPLSEAVWQTIEAALAKQAIYCAQLLAGQMPPDIEDVFHATDTPLFPQHRNDVRMSCTCPDPAVPCKHLAAACYLLAESFDDDPFRILQWRGRDRPTLLAQLRHLRSYSDPTIKTGGDTANYPTDAGTVPDPAPMIGTMAALTELAGDGATPDETIDDRFWLPPVPLPSTRPPTLPTKPDLLLRQLPTPGPILGSDQLLDRLRAVYRQFGAASTSND